MTLNTETLSALRSVDRLDAIVKHLKSMPLAHRADAIETIQRGLARPNAARLNYIWPLYARDSQLPPEEDWDTWRKLTWPSDAIIQITRITVQTTPTHSPTNQPILQILTSCKS